MSELSQEQIDALLRGEDIHVEPESDKVQKIVNAVQAEKTSGILVEQTPSPAVAMPQEEIEEIAENISEYLTSDEVDALGEMGNIAMGTSATTMSAVLGHRVVITTPSVQLFKPEHALTSYRCPFLAVSVGYSDGIHGKNLLILKEYDAAVITDVMMGGDGHIEWEETSTLSEIHFSAISEIMNQMIGSAATAMSNMLGKPVNITPPHADMIDIDGDVSELMDHSRLLIRTSFDMEIEGVLNSKLLQIMPLDLAKELVRTQLESAAPTVQDTLPARSASSVPVAPPQTPKPAPKPKAPPMTQHQPMVSVQQAVMPDFDMVDMQSSNSNDLGNLELINDIPLQVTVELGRTHKSLMEVMHFGVGTIIVLDRMAGEPVDVIVNGKRIARGEVVVIDENYGVRINEIFNDSKS